MTRTLLASAALLIACSTTACDAPPQPEAPPKLARQEMARSDAAPPDAPAEHAAAPPTSAPLVEPIEAEALLVWGRDEEGFTYTWWVEPDEAIDAQSAAGTIIAIDGALWYWVVEEEPVTVALDCDLLAEVASEEGVGARAFLARVDDGERREVLAPAVSEARASAEFEEHAELMGSLGPYLFVHRSAYSYHCGAHGGSEHASFVWDVRTRAATSLYGPEELDALRAASEERARAALMEQTDGFSLHVDDDVRLTLLRPTFAPSGAAQMVHRWTTGVPYALSDGGWDSYTASTELTASELPPALAPFAARSAEAVRRVREAAPDITIGGVSVPDPSLRELFEELPDEGC